MSFSLTTVCTTIAHLGLIILYKSEKMGSEQGRKEEYGSRDPPHVNFVRKPRIFLSLSLQLILTGRQPPPLPLLDVSIQNYSKFQIIHSSVTY